MEKPANLKRKTPEDKVITPFDFIASRLELVVKIIEQNKPEDVKEEQVQSFKKEFSKFTPPKFHLYYKDRFIGTNYQLEKANKPKMDAFTFVWDFLDIKWKWIKKIHPDSFKKLKSIVNDIINALDFLILGEQAVTLKNKKSKVEK